jgi:hypothetical protein
MCVTLCARQYHNGPDRSSRLHCEGADAARAGRSRRFDDTPLPCRLSSLFKHLVKHGAALRNPVVDVDRPAINRIEGSTAAFSKMLPPNTLADLRDRAILSVGLQVGFRRRGNCGTECRRSSLEPRVRCHMRCPQGLTQSLGDQPQGTTHSRLRRRWRRSVCDDPPTCQHGGKCPGGNKK